MRTARPRRLTMLAATAALAAAVAQAPAAVAAPAPTAAPVLTQLSRLSVPFWGGNQIAVFGRNFTDVRQVTFGGAGSYGFQVVSPTKIVATYPEHARGRVAVQVVTGHGTSHVTHPGLLTYRDPNDGDPINGGWTVHQEQALSARYTATTRQRGAVAMAPKHAAWTPATGRVAVNRARNWLGMPYSFAGGNATGPTRGVCSTSQGTAGALDCHVVGFDCSGLAMYAWGPYLSLPHYAATQFAVAGASHPRPANLMPGDLVFFGSSASTIHHVAIYEGGGKLIQAPQSGRPVNEVALSDALGWDYFGATRPRSSGAHAAVPTITHVLNQVPTAGGWVTLSTANLGDVTSVTVGGRLSYAWKMVGSRVAVQMPAHVAGPVNVAVNNEWGASKSVPVRYAAKPAATVVSPSSGPSAGGTSIVLHGTGFRGVTKVTFGSVAAPSMRVWSDGTITLVTPAHTAGRLNITLYSIYGTSVVPGYVYAAPVTPARRTVLQKHADPMHRG